MLQLVIFLGNPGLMYRYNRHNAAWMLADAIPFLSEIAWQNKFKGLHTSVDGIHFLKPQDFMNRCGESAHTAASFYKIDPENIIIVHDEIELSFGTLSLKFSGGMGGHNGLRSIKNSFDSADFWRLRLGIGRPDSRIPGKGGNPESSREAGIADWVLSDFTDAENEMLAEVFTIGGELLVQALKSGPEQLLPEWAKKRVVQ